MFENRRLISLCTSRVFDPQVHSFVEKLNEELKTHNCCLWIYAINSDLYWEEDADRSETSVFEMINWASTDVVIIMDEKIKSRTVSQSIIDKAQKKKVPVIVVDGDYEDTTMISFDYATGFEEIVKHVIEEHKVKRPHIMAGFKGNKFSDERIEVFKNVIEKNGISFTDDMISYGEFWARPAREAAHELLNRAEFPDAVICANDIMAINVCDVFMKAGKRIPQDVIVTGFDGFDEALLSTPAVTTSSCRTSELAGMTARAVFDRLEGRSRKNYPVKPRLIKNESCGCPHSTDSGNSAMKSFNTGFYRYQDDIRQQHTISARMHMCESTEEMVNVLHDYYMPHVSCIIKNSCFRTNRNFFLEESDQGDYCMFYNSEKPDQKIMPFDMEHVLDDFEDSLTNGYPLIFNSLDYMNKTMGFACYSFPTYDLTEYSKTAGISNMISVGLGGFINMRYQQYLLSKVEEMYKADALTGLYNRIAFHEAFEKMKKDPRYDGKNLTVIMADLDGLKKINDTYGHDAGDHAIAAVATALKSVCPKESLCVRFGGDEMLAFVPDKDGADDIILEVEGVLTAESERLGYPVAASCGSYTVRISADIDMEDIVKQADEKMYAVKHERKNAKK